jgi:hypothetical protein
MRVKGGRIEGKRERSQLQKKKEGAIKIPCSLNSSYSGYDDDDDDNMWSLLR